MRILQKIVANVARQKFRFDLGAGFMTVINFAFVVIAASDKLATFVNVSAKVMVIVLVPLAVLSVWLLGFTLDRVKFLNAYMNEHNKRNQMLVDAVRNVER